MSKLVWVNYRISEAEERESRRKMELLRQTLKRCAALRKLLSELEPVAGENWAESLATYEQLINESRWNEFTPDYNRLYDALPGVVADLEKALSEARAKRTRLELTAATLTALGASSEEQAILAKLGARTATLYADKYEAAAGEVERMLRKRLETPLTAAAADTPTASQLALAAELLALSGGSTPMAIRLPSPSEPQQPSDAARINRLVDQIAGLDTSLASFDDLLERLRELPDAEKGRRALLIDSIELAAGERLHTARRKREVQELAGDGLAWLSPYSSLSADEHRRKLDAAATTGDPAAVRTARDDARKWAEDEARRQDGARVRSALVAELQELGYEVNVQGHEWSEGTRITAVRPNESNYDVQLSAVPGGQIQSKVRAYDHAGRGAGVNRRDVEVEQSWCDDLAKVNKLLAERGIRAEVLREDGPGTAAQLPLPARHDRNIDAPSRPTQLERKS